MASAAAAVLSVVVMSPGPVRMSVIIPTRNQASAISRALADLPADLVSEILVIDTQPYGRPEIAAKMGACVIDEFRLGYCRACLKGLATADAPDVVPHPLCD